MHILFVELISDPLMTTNSLQNKSGFTVNYVAADDNKSFADIILFDAQLGENKIKQQINLYKQLNAQLQWLIVDINNNIQQAIKYLQLGASGILNSPYRDINLEDLVATINHKTLYLNDDLKQILALRQIQRTLQPFNMLSSREFDVFCLLAENFTIDYIADNLKVSSKTAFNCQSQIRKKLGLSNQQQITQFAKSHRLIL